MDTRRISASGVASSCYFRSSEIAPGRKALVQITERCNLHCAHCFVSATREGRDMNLAQIEACLLPRLRVARVRRLTLTGGEPFAHPQIMEIATLARRSEMTVTICSNGTLIDGETITELSALGVKVNVSLDGFSPRGHGKFRGAPSSFGETVETMRTLGEKSLLKGVLVTPNRLAEVSEYEQLCEFARSCGAEYVLMNPLSPLGRGSAGIRRLGATEEFMRAVAIETGPAEEAGLELVRIRFPNDSRPLSACEAGTILYVFAGGDLTVCPYLVFAANTAASRHNPQEFIVGNIFEHEDIADRLESYPLQQRVKLRRDPTCGSCAIADRCGGGCPAAVIAAGGEIGERDREQCPVRDAA
jgi:radical SAM protein with 4Fe4S-binding SPASM domain